MAVLRILACGLAAAAAWWAGIVVVFGPAQAILADPARQSPKFLAAFTEPPLPRIAEDPGEFALGLVAIGCIHAAVFAWLAPRLPAGTLRRGVAFGIVAWALMVPWFEFYLPWNVMREPLPLVLLEGLCWLVVLVGVGLAIALVHGRMAPRTAPTGGAA
jgi:hypothetical protein